MKKLICILCAMILLGGAAAAEQSAGEACQHEYWLYNELLAMHRWLIDGGTEAVDAVSAICTLCDDRCIVIRDKGLITAEPCDPEACTHRLYTLPNFTRAVWLPTADEDGEPIHELVEYDVGICIDCNTVAAVCALKATDTHQMEEKKGFHVEGQYIHAACWECDLCGLMTGELVPCISYEDGSCDRLPAQK